MLDFAALAAQMEEMFRSQREWLSAAAIFQTAHSLCRECDSNGNFNSIVRAAEEDPAMPDSWHPATLLNNKSSLCQSRPAPEAPLPHRVAAADGSQIYPDAHHIAFCYLLHISRISLRYGHEAGSDFPSSAKVASPDTAPGESAQLEATPHFFFEGMDDAWHVEAAKQAGLPSSDLVDARRHVEELNALADLLEASNETTVGLCDGIFELRLSASLPWRDFAETENNRALERLKQTGHPVAGYIAASRAVDVVTSLRVVLEEKLQTGLLTESAAERPREALGRLNDVRLFDGLLRPGERSAVFLSHRNVPRKRDNQGAKSRSDSSQHASCFFYLKIDEGEVARLEFPHWVAQHAPWLDLVHALVLEQIEKGDGYPIALMEAHEHAVVRNTDRETFYALLEDLMLAQGMEPRRSAKMRSKIRPMV
jgi:hypothetical protein